jgi:hypothetical protein
MGHIKIRNDNNPTLRFIGPCKTTQKTSMLQGEGSANKNREWRSNKYILMNEQQKWETLEYCNLRANAVVSFNK